MKIRIILILLLTVCIAIGLKAQTARATNNLLDYRLVDLKQKPGTTVFINLTADTLRLSGVFFNWLPYVENDFTLTIAPGKRDSLVFRFSYPDFIMVNNSFRIYNGPNRRVVCNVNALSNKSLSIDFKGDFFPENTYYLSYNKFLDNYDEESRPYYKAGDKLADFNKFPAIADSVTKTRLDFLDSYQLPLDISFKKQERKRLIYNGIMRKYNVLISKEFYSHMKLDVRDDYFDFEKDLNLTDPEMVLNTEYLWATDFYLLRRSKKLNKPVPDPSLYVIDSLAKGTDAMDVLKMRRLPMIYISSRAKYDSVFSLALFKSPDHKADLDSLIQTKLGLPKIRNNVPKTTLKDINGKAVTLSDFAGKVMIINFWAIWCGPCIAEFPNENSLYSRYKGKGLVVINICVDSDIERWKLISKRDNLQMINLFADSEAYRSIKNRFNIGALPRSILVGRDVKVFDNYFKRASMITDRDIENVLGR